MKNILLEIKVRLWMLWKVLTDKDVILITTVNKDKDVLFLSNRGDILEVKEILENTITHIESTCE